MYMCNAERVCAQEVIHLYLKSRIVKITPSTITLQASKQSVDQTSDMNFDMHDDLTHCNIIVHFQATYQTVFAKFNASLYLQQHVLQCV